MNRSPGTILVTGATGFIGRHACAVFAASGWRVRGLTHSSSAMPPGVTPIRVNDLVERAGVRRAVSGADAVLHLAARVHQLQERHPDPMASYRHTNVDGTRALVSAARDAGVSTFLFASSVKAVGESTREPWTEDSAPNPATPYGLSKLEAEAVVRDAADSSRGAMRAAIVRLPMVYGPDMTGNMLRLFRWVDSGVPIPLGAVDNRRSIAFVGNVLSAFASLSASAFTGAQTYFVADDNPISTPHLVRLIGAALGCSPRLIPIPMGPLRVAAALGDRVASVVPGWPIRSALVESLCGSLSVTTQKLHAAAPDWAPVATSAGLSETARWFRANARNA